MAMLSRDKMIQKFGFSLCEQLAALDQQGYTISAMKKMVAHRAKLTDAQVRKCIEAFYDRVQA